MTTNLKWRLSKLPTPEELRGLVADKIITQEEARDILFKKEDDAEGPSKEALKSEIEFLRKLVEKLSSGTGTTKIVEYIYSYPRPSYGWYQPYYSWCSSQNAISTGGSGVSLTYSTSSGSDIQALTAANTDSSNLQYMLSNNGSLYATGQDGSFSSIKTF